MPVGPQQRRPRWGDASRERRGPHARYPAPESRLDDVGLEPSSRTSPLNSRAWPGSVVSCVASARHSRHTGAAAQGPGAGPLSTSMRTSTRTSSDDDESWVQCSCGKARSERAPPCHPWEQEGTELLRALVAVSAPVVQHVCRPAWGWGSGPGRAAAQISLCPCGPARRPASGGAGEGGRGGGAVAALKAVGAGPGLAAYERFT